MSEKKRKRTSREDESYGNPDFKGRGIIKCAACGDPLRDHPIGPCQAFNQQIIYVGQASSRTRSGVPKR